MYYEIKWKSGKIITNAPTVEEAIENFKKLKIEVPDKEISISKFGQSREKVVKSIVVFNPISFGMGFFFK